MSVVASNQTDSYPYRAIMQTSTFYTQNSRLFRTRASHKAPQLESKLSLVIGYHFKITALFWYLLCEILQKKIVIKIQNNWKIN